MPVCPSAVRGGPSLPPPRGLQEGSVPPTAVLPAGCGLAVLPLPRPRVLGCRPLPPVSGVDHLGTSSLSRDPGAGSCAEGPASAGLLLPSCSRGETLWVLETQAQK